ncbi:SGNH/GDSL hydrolase family protein [uncultured Bacteroides sp.]|nr:SGNH/GDSL hydrolase family protein [uncultured Bacteroides sp.]
MFIDEYATQGENLLDLNTITEGIALRTDGSFNVSSSSFVSALIPVKENTRYSQNFMTGGAIAIWLNNKKEIISTFTASASIWIDSPEEAAFVQMTGILAKKEEAMFCEGNSLPKAYKKYNPIIRTEKIEGHQIFADTQIINEWDVAIGSSDFVNIPFNAIAGNELSISCELKDGLTLPENAKTSLLIYYKDGTTQSVQFNFKDNSKIIANKETDYLRMVVANATVGETFKLIIDIKSVVNSKFEEIDKRFNDTDDGLKSLGFILPKQTVLNSVIDTTKEHIWTLEIKKGDRFRIRCNVDSEAVISDGVGATMAKTTGGNQIILSNNPYNEDIFITAPIDAINIRVLFSGTSLNSDTSFESIIEYYGISEMYQDARLSPTPLLFKKILLFADSISDMTSTEVGIPSIKKYPYFLEQIFGCIFNNQAKWGTGYLADNSKNDGTYYQRMTNVVETDFDYVIISSGVNDYINSTGDYVLGEIGEEIFDESDPKATTNNLCGAIDATFKKAIEKFGSTSKIAVITPLYCYTTVAGKGIINCMEKNKAGFSLYDLVEKIKYYCHKYGIPFLDLFEIAPFYVMNDEFKKKYTFRQFTNDGDGLHPITEWHKNVYTYIVARFLANL